EGGLALLLNNCATYQEWPACLRRQFLTQCHDPNQHQTEDEQNRCAAFRYCRCCGTRECEVKTGSGTLECKGSRRRVEPRNMGDTSSAECHRARLHVPVC